MKYLLRTNFDCFVKIDGIPHKLFAGLDEIVQVKNDNKFFEVLPQNTLNNGYCFENKNDKNNEKYTILHPFARLIQIESDCAILFLQQAEQFEKKTLAELSTKLNDYEIIQNDKVEIKCAGEPIYRANFLATSGELNEHQNLVFATFENQNEKRVIIFDSANNILIKDIITSIEYTENGFSLLKKMNDIHKQGLVKKYVIKNNILSLDEEYAVYYQNTAKQIYNEQISLLAFFECVRAKNFNLAKTYLSANLKDKISNQHFLAYFGEFDEIVDCSKLFDKHIFALISNIQKSCNLFEITLDNYKIENITPVLIE